MAKTVVIVGTLDTKGAEFAFLKERIAAHGLHVLVVDAGVRGEPRFTPDVSAAEVAEAGGARLEDLVARGDRGEALEVMSRGVAVIAKRLYEEGKLDGIISMGGGGGTALGTSAMRALPLDVPKLMVSTVASGDTSPYVGTTNITMMPSVVDVAGVNRISRRIFAHAADAIAGMVLGSERDGSAEAGPLRPLVAASMFGNTTRAVDHARSLTEKAGYETLVFHATGTGGNTMEMLIADGYFHGVLDVTITELVDEMLGGVLAAGPERLTGAVKAGIPQVVAPGCIDMCNFWAPETVPDRYRNRRLHRWNPNVTLMRTTPEENARLAEIVAERLNSGSGPAAVFIPTQGFSELDAPGGPFWWPEANAAFIDTLKTKLRSDIPITLMDHNVNDPPFAAALAETLLTMMKEAAVHGNE